MTVGGWVGLAIIAVMFTFWLAAIWNKPGHRDVACDDGCDCGLPHRQEALMSDTLFAMSGLWLIVGWDYARPAEVVPRSR
jgi:hypothetical protein